MPAGRKPLSIADQVKRLPGSPVAKARLRVILDNLAGQIGSADACAELGIEQSWFFDLKQESLKRWVKTLEPGSPGRRPSVQQTPEQQEIAELKQQVERLELALKAAQLRTELARKGLSRPEPRAQRAANKASR
jgi:transposase-like protein